MVNYDFTYLDVIYNVADNHDVDLFNQMLNAFEGSDIHRKLFLLCSRYDFENRVWLGISYIPNLRMNFIRKFHDKLRWKFVCDNSRLSEGVMREFSEFVDLEVVSYRMRLSEAFIDEFKDRLNMVSISRGQRLSEDFIRRNSGNFGNMCWSLICRYQRLSEDFIQEFWYKVDWHAISGNQRLSYDFLKKHEKNVSLSTVLQNPKISTGTKRKFKSFYMKKFRKK